MLKKRILPTVMAGLLVWSSSVSAVEVRLRSTATCAGSVVRLADVADIVADNTRLGRALEDTSLCPSPAHGSTKNLSRAELRELLALSGADPGKVQITGSEFVTVTAGGAGSRTSLKKGPMAVSAVRQAIFESATATLPPTDPRPVSAAPASAETREPAIAPVIERGASVTVHAATTGIRISTSGKALETGGSGQMISVELADSKQRVQARVVGPQLVEVAVGANTVAP